MDFLHDILPLKDRLYRLALRVTSQRQESEDVVQDVMLKLWQRRDQLADITNLEAYALRMTYRRALDLARRHSNLNVTLDQCRHDRPDSSAPSPHQQLAAQERQQQMEQIIQQLPHKQQIVLQLRDMEGKTYKEISDVLGISESDVKVTLHRARNTIREKWTQK